MSKSAIRPGHGLVWNEDYGVPYCKCQEERCELRMAIREVRIKVRSQLKLEEAMPNPDAPRRNWLVSTPEPARGSKGPKEHPGGMINRKSHGVREQGLTEAARAVLQHEYVEETASWHNRTEDETLEVPKSLDPDHDRESLYP